MDGNHWMPVREAAELIKSTPATIYNQVENGTIGKMFIGKTILLVSKEDALEYGKTKKSYFKRFTKVSKN